MSVIVLSLSLLTAALFFIPAFLFLAVFKPTRWIAAIVCLAWLITNGLIYMELEERSQAGPKDMREWLRQYGL